MQEEKPRWRKLEERQSLQASDVIGVPEATAVSIDARRDSTPHHKTDDTRALPRVSKDIKDAVGAFSTRSVPVLEPNGTFMRCWRPFIFFLVLMAVVLVPFELGFSWWSAPTVYKVCMKLVDLCFIVDMIIHFNTGFVHDDHVVHDRKEIAKHYAKSWLLPDCLSNFPWDWFISAQGKKRKFLKFLKLPKILRFIRMLRALKEQMHYIGTGGSLFGIALFSHWCSCMWAFGMVSPCDELSVVSCPDVAGTYLEGVSVSMSGITGSDSWTRWIGPENSNRMASLRNAYEKLAGSEEFFATIIMMLGYMLLACLFGTVAAAMQHMNERGRARALKLQSRKQDMRQAHVPLNLQRRVQATYEHAWMFGDWHDGLFTDATLSLDLRRNLALHVYGPALRAVPMFKNFADHDLKCLAQKIVSRCYTPGDLIIQVGERAAEIFFIFTGSARPVDKQGNEMHNVLLRKGDFFGEICFLSPGSRRTASVLCVEFCRAMVLTLQVFEELGLDGLLESIREECLDNMKQYGEADIETRVEEVVEAPPAPGAPKGKAKPWGKKKAVKPKAPGTEVVAQSREDTSQAAKDGQLTTITRMIHELVEAVERNAAEVMNRLDLVERRQDELFSMCSNSTGAKPAKSATGRTVKQNHDKF